MSMCAREASVDNIANMTKVAEAAIVNDTNLMVKEDNVFKLARFCHGRNADEISRAVLMGEITVSDIAILKAVCNLGQAHVEAVKLHLDMLKALYPDRLILQSTVDSVRARLMELSKYGCLLAQEVLFENGKKIVLYSCTEAGVTLIRKQLSTNIYYERFINIENKCDMFRHVVGGYIGVVLANRLDCKEYKPAHYNKIFRVNAKKDPYFYSMITTEREDGVVVDYVVVPLYFELDRGLLTEKERTENYKEQLRMYDDWIAENKKQRNRETKVVVCVENYEGMKKACRLIKETTPYMLDKCYFTSERVICEMRGAEEKAFFKTIINGNRASFTVVDITKQ